MIGAINSLGLVSRHQPEDLRVDKIPLKGGTPNRICLRKDQNMDWRVMLTTFGIIFLAEMGDKTQIAAMTMAAEKKRPWEVFIAASLALAAVSAIGVVVGSTLSHVLPLEWIKRAAGAAFIVIGLLVLLGKF